VPVSRYLEMLRFEDAIYPKNYAKLRYVENHDNERVMQSVPDRNQALAWTAFEAFNYGAFLIYAGQESAAVHTPSLFDIDKVEWKDYELSGFLATLANLKKDPAQVQGVFTIMNDNPAVQAVWSLKDRNLYGIFNVSGNKGKAEVQMLDGRYENLLGGDVIEVNAGKMDIPETAAILRVPGDYSDVRPFHSDLMDTFVG
jgi:hypothetical protein